VRRSGDFPAERVNWLDGPTANLEPVQEAMMSTGYLRASTTRYLLAAVGFVVGLLGLYAYSHQSTVDGEAQEFEGEARPYELEVDYKSKYSHLKVTRQNNVRTLWFVRDNGEEVVESQVDLDRKYDLLIEYTQFMFSSYLFRPAPERVLIVGLGGGSMVHFLNHYDRKVKVDVVEIDPAIVQIAGQYFGVRGGGNLKITTGDGTEYLKNTRSLYDVIYMDAFLKPSQETDDTGVPMRMKTVQFYKEVQKKLNPDGVVVFNLNPHAGLDDDVKTIREAFPQVYVFGLNGSGLVVVGSTAEKRVGATALARTAAQLDHRFKATFSFHAMVRRLLR
jgi:spermidine synthase